MAEMTMSEHDRDAFVFAQSKMRSGIEVVLLTVIGSNDASVPIGALCAISADKEHAGDQRWSKAFSAAAQPVLARGDGMTVDRDGLSVLIMRVG